MTHTPFSIPSLTIHTRGIGNGRSLLPPAMEDGGSPDRMRSSTLWYAIWSWFDRSARADAKGLEDTTGYTLLRLVRVQFSFLALILSDDLDLLINFLFSARIFPVPSSISHVTCCALHFYYFV